MTMAEKKDITSITIISNV